MKKKMLLTLIALLTLVALTAANLPPRPLPIPLDPPDLAALSLTIYADRAQAKAGEPVTFTILVSNPDAWAVSGARIWSLFPEELEIIRVSTTKGSANVKAGLNKFSAWVGTLQPGDSATITVQAVVRKGSAAGSAYYSGAKVTYGNRVIGAQRFSNWAAVKVVE